MKKVFILTAAFLLLSSFTGLVMGQTAAVEHPFMNPDLSIDDRVEDLVSRLTLQEKVDQMKNQAPAIERLGIPACNWWNECLHGVARTEYKVTVFPQAIGMAATFDVPSMFRAGEIVSTEARAIYNDTKRTHGEGLQYHGLMFWTPNINIFRDPRWGRGQETYGEDPYLTGELGKAYVEGLQGRDSILLKVSACAKHFAVHSGPEASRHSFNSITDDYDLWDTYLPAFRRLVVDAHVSSVMGAYNRFRGQPCCANDLLDEEILDGYWKFDGYYTSDCGAINDFHTNHKTHGSPAESAADAVKHGTDLECGSVYSHLVEAVRQGLITEQEIDKSVSELFRIRFRLGMFNPEENDPYAKIPVSVLECVDHQAHALKMAHESIVLLKNNGLLPLTNNISKIAVLGPNADNPEVQLGNYNGFPTDIVTPLKGIRSKTSSEVIYFPATDYVSDRCNEADLEEKIGDADLVIFVGGISPRLEGEEGKSFRDMNLPGFSKGDRSSILLPQVQREVMEMVKRMGKPLVFVSMSGSAIAFPWVKENADAILQAWYGGQSVGTALADVLWGDYNPSGRLPVTFYADDSQLPPFESYSMMDRTYRYFKGEPMYPFGYGLSYTDFEYSSIELDRTKVRTGEDVKVTVHVRNIGSRAGDEVVQLYVSHPGAPDPKPLAALKGIKRIHLLPGEEQIVQFVLDTRDLSLVGRDGISRCSAGEVRIMVGGCSPAGTAPGLSSVVLRVKGHDVALGR